MASAFCSQRARSHDVSPTGTATEAAHWLLIEDPSPWGEHAVEDADWYPQVGDTIEMWEDAVSDLRVQLIRRGLTTWDAPGRIRCLAVRAGPQPVVRSWSVNAYRDLAALPVVDALQAAPDEDDPPLLVLTCVNGRRDACCSKWGRPVAEAAAEAAPEAAWQTSHLGGHRFAPTALVLPHGTHYGWLRPDELPDLVAAHRNGQLYDLDRVRGSVHQPRPVQAAGLALRARLGIMEVTGVEGAIVTAGDERWTVQVEADDDVYRAQVRWREREAAFPHSCGSDEAKADLAWDVTWEEAVPRPSKS